MQLFTEIAMAKPTSVAHGGELTRVARLYRVISRQGFFAVARRKTSQAIEVLAERLRVGRLAGRSWKPDGRPVFLMISHHCGGGTERHVAEMASALRSEGVRPIFVRPSGSSHVLWEERDDGGRATWCRRSTREFQSIGLILSILRPIHAHVHHVMGLPDGFVERLHDHGVTYDWTIHDYYSICPRVNLIDGSGAYCGEPDAASCDRCLAQCGDDQGRPVKGSISAWRERHGSRLASARRVFAPSEDVRERLARYFPDLGVLVRPHPETLPMIDSLAARLVPGETVRVAVVGSIVAIKGSERLLACARDARDRKLPLVFHVIGSTDRDAVFARIGNVHISGRYREQEVYHRLAQARCHLAFLPSLCPESFMYSLSITMAARLFVFCFKLGAQADRLREWGWGQPLALDASPATINDALVAVARSLANGPAAPAAPQAALYPRALGSYYDFTGAELAAFQLAPGEQDRPVGSSPHFARKRDHAHLH